MIEEEYIDFCKMVESKSDDVYLTEAPHHFRQVIAMAITMGQIMDHYKRHIFYGTELDTSKIYSLVVNLISFEAPDETPCRMNRRLLHGIMGLFTESAELLENFEKDEVDVVNIVEEMGDIQWYEAILLDELSSTWTDIREINQKKLQARYGNSFSKEKATNRDLKTERNILEGKE